MTTIDKRLLLSEIKLMGTTVKDMCSAIGITPPSFYRKLNGRSDFYRDEIIAIRDYLNLSEEKTRLIFFPENVSFSELSVSQTSTKEPLCQSP